MNDDYQVTVPCRICGKQTRMHGTKLCDNCWELERRIQENPEAARKVLDALEKESAQ